MKILIIGIGNPGRGDDGLGPALAAGLAGADAETLTEGAVIEIPGRSISAVWKYQLNIEDAALVRDYDAVVFADASRKSGEPVAFGEIAPAAAIAFTTHELSPRPSWPSAKSFMAARQGASAGRPRLFMGTRRRPFS